MLGFRFGITVALCLLSLEAADSADLRNPQSEAAQFTVLGDRLLRQARFEDAESAYSAALKLDPANVRGHLGMGKIATMLSDGRRAATHHSAAYQADPRNPDAILAFADSVEDRESRQVLLLNFLALSTAQDERRGHIRARLEIEERLGARKLAVLESPYRPYRIALSNLRTGGLVLDARINGCRDLKLIIDTGAAGIVLNASAAQNAGLEFLAPAGLTGFGTALPTLARVSLASSFETGEFRLTNLLIDVSDTELTPEADGVIGLDVFQDFLIRLDPRARRLDLRPLEEGCPNCTQAYRVGHLLLIYGEVNGHSSGYFILDTGSPYTMISQALIPRTGRLATMTGAKGVQVVSMPDDRATLRLGTQHLWGFEYATLDTSEISSSNGISIAGAIGYSLLRQLSLTVDYRRGLVKLSPPDRQ